MGTLGGLVTERHDERRVVDLKKGGLLGVTDLARVAAVRGGVASSSTRERLHDSVAVGALELDEARALEEAFETFMEIRMDRQVECVRRGDAVDSLVEPAAMDPVNRSRLRQAFRVVDVAQARLRGAFAGGRFASI